MTVEGEKYLSGKLLARVDSTEPGETQRLADFAPATLEVTCSPDDSHGALQITGDNSGIQIQKRSRRMFWVVPLRGTESVPVKDLSKPVTFSGDERVSAQSAKSLFNEEVVLRHQRGAPTQPPFRRERIPRIPFPPFNRAHANVQPQVEPGKELSAVGKPIKR